MKKLIILLSCLLLFVTAVGATLNCGEKDDGTTPTKITWRLALVGQNDTLPAKLLQEFADKVKADSKGRLEIKVFPGGSLYQMLEIFDAVSSGAIDMGQSGVTSYIGKEPKTASAMVYTSTVADSVSQMVAIDTAMSVEFTPMITEASKDGIRNLFWGPLGTTDSFFNFPVNTMGDLKGKKLGCTAGVAPVVQLLGATPVPMDIADAYLSMKTGLIDGWVIAPLEFYASFKLYEVAPYLVSFSFVSISAILMNQNSFNALPEDLQTIVETNALATQADWITRVAASDAGYIKTLQANPDVHVKILTPAERETWFTAAIRPVFTGMANKYLTADEIAQMNAIITRVKTTGK